MRLVLDVHAELLLIARCGFQTGVLRLERHVTASNVIMSCFSYLVSPASSRND
jgi:hypothetical protein